MPVSKPGPASSSPTPHLGKLISKPEDRGLPPLLPWEMQITEALAPGQEPSLQPHPSTEQNPKPGAFPSSSQGGADLHFPETSIMQASSHAYPPSPNYIFWGVLPATTAG